MMSNPSSSSGSEEGASALLSKRRGNSGATAPRRPPAEELGVAAARGRMVAPGAYASESDRDAQSVVFTHASRHPPPSGEAGRRSA